MASNNRINITINGIEIANEIGAIESAFKKLNNQVKTLTVGEAEYNKKIEELAQLKSVLTDHRTSINGISNGYSLASSTLKTFTAYAGVAFGADAIISYGKEVFKAGIELSVFEKKARIVFGEALPGVTKAAEENATAMGLTSSQYVKAAADIGDLLIPMGFTRDAAAQMSVQLTNMGGVLSEWSGGTRSAAEVTHILNKALLGERDELKSLGIQISEEQVKQELQKKGYQDLTGRALEQAKALVTLEMIMSKSADAQTTYANGSDSIIRKQAEMSAKFAQIKEDLGTILIPLFAGLTALVSPLVGALSNLVSGFNSLESAQTKSAKSTQMMQIQFNIEMDTLKAGNLTHDARNQLIDSMNKKYKEYLPNLITESSSIADISRLQAIANEKFSQKITLMAAEGALVETQKKLLEVKKQELGLQIDLQKQQEIYAIRGKVTTAAQMDANVAAADEVGIRKRAVDANLSEQKRLQAEFEKTMNAARALGIDVAKAIGTDISNKPITPDKSMSTVDPKDLEKAAKELQKKLDDIAAIVKKHDDDLKLLNSQRLKDIAANYDAQIALAESAQQREDLIKRRDYELTLQRDIEAIDQRYVLEVEKLRVLEKDKSQKVSDAAKAAIIQLDKDRDLEISILRAEREKKRTEDEIKIITDREKAKAQAAFDEAEVSRKFLEERQKGRESAQGEVSKFLALGENKDQTFAEEVSALDTHFNQLLAMADDFGINTNALADKYLSEKAALEKKYADKDEKTQREKNIKRLEGQSKLYSELGNLAGGLSDLFQQEGEKQSSFQKVLVLSQIAFDTASAISALVAASQKNPANGVTFGVAGALQYAAGLAQILSGINRARNLFKEAPEVKKQKYMGGFETVQGATDGQYYSAQNITQSNTGLLSYNTPVITPSGILANEKGKEYYVSASDLRKPAVMNYVKAIDAITQRADGGYAPATPSVSAADNATQMAMLAAIQQNNQLMSALLTQGVQAKVSDKTIIDIESRFQTLNGLSNNYYRN